MANQKVEKALEMADRAYVLQSRRAVLSCTGEELLGHPDVKKCCLGM